MFKILSLACLVAISTSGSLFAQCVGANCAAGQRVRQVVQRVVQTPQRMVQRQPVIIEAVETVQVQAASDFGTQSLRDRLSFRQALLKAAEQSFAEGEAAVAAGKPRDDRHISRLDMMRLRVFLLVPGNVAKLQQVVSEQAVLEGHATSIAAIDWGRLFDTLKELMPYILELIKLFA